MGPLAALLAPSLKNLYRSENNFLKLILSPRNPRHFSILNSAAKTSIVPQFYNSLVDIAFGFAGQPFKRSRTKLKLYTNWSYRYLSIGGTRDTCKQIWSTWRIIY